MNWGRTRRGPRNISADDSASLGERGGAGRRRTAPPRLAPPHPTPPHPTPLSAFVDGPAADLVGHDLVGHDLQLAAREELREGLHPPALRAVEEVDGTILRGLFDEVVAPRRVDHPAPREVDVPA